ncbi:MAG: amylo-alpha-1,6-glucosidase [Thermomicrobiales bacterium]|nr:amylo-alpha-1,6-glucosidase [Thermomicrobiales bacterium]
MPHRELVLKSPELFFVNELSWESIRNRAAGLYFRDTRHLNSVRVHLNDQRPEVLAITPHSAASATITSTNPYLDLAGGVHLLPHTVAIEQRVMLDSSLNLTWVLHNYARIPAAFDFRLLCSADFRDVFDIRGFPRHRFGTRLRPHASEGAIHLRYRAEDGSIFATSLSFDRQPRIDLRRINGDHEEVLVPLLPGMDDLAIDPAPEDMAGVLLSFPVALEPGDRWELRVSVTPAIEETREQIARPTQLGQSHSGNTTIVTDNPLFNRVMHRSQQDLEALMTRFPQGNLIAAGIPWYVAPFGRDSLIAGLQTVHIAPHGAEGTLRLLASLQGAKVDPATEEEPGKILHEMRYGEMARNGEIPHRPYFGTIDATPLFILLFAETVAWTSSDTLYNDLLPNVLAALEWVDAYGDSDGDGMIDYDATPTEGIRIRHRVWKDSLDSLHHVDGREPSGRVAPVEVQGYLFAAYRKLAVVAAAYGDGALAIRLEAKANQLQQRFELDFWMDDEGFYAQALDGDRSPMRSISSNAGQLLFTGIAKPERAAAVAHLLRHPDMESGWGVRTLSASSTSYNPMSYHNGSIWPHDNSLIADGCYRIGETKIGNEIFCAMFDAARLSVNERLNELYCGFSRSGAGADAPVPYPTACSPQAWAAGTLPYLLRGALGLEVDLSQHAIRLDPHFPPFLNEVSIHHLSALGHTGNLIVRRDGDEYSLSSDDLPVMLEAAGSSDHL